MPLSFLVPAFLAGLAALAIPVLIHLSRRQSDRVQEFPSLMFVRRIPQQTVQRRRLRDLFLLMLRCTAVAVLVAAFARPFLDQPDAAAAPESGSREMVILLDRSASMGYGERWARAQQAARDALEELESGDRATLLVFDEGAEALTRSTRDRGVLRAALEDARPGAARGRFTSGLKLAESVLASSTLPRRELVLISDFQRTGWDGEDGAAGVQLPAGTTVKPVSVAEDDAANLAITRVDFEQETQSGRDRVTAVARMVNQGARALRGLPVSLEIGGRALESRPLDLEPGEAATVAFAPFTLSQLNTRGTVRAGDDPLTADNAFHFVLSPGSALSVLVLEGPSAPRDVSLYLRRALAIGRDPGFRVEVRRAGVLSEADLRDRAVVILNDAPLPDGDTGRRLREFVQRGGGLVVIAGPSAGSRLSAEWLGGTLGGSGRTNADGAALGYVDYSHPIFEPFTLPRSGDFASARFFGYRPLSAPGDARVLARFGDGSTALAEIRVGRGRVLAWGSSLDRSWNDLALQPVFLPFAHQLVKHAAGHTPPGAWLTVGQVLDASQPGAGGEFTWARTPSGERMQLDAAAPLRLGEQGFYEFRRGATGEELGRLIAVNLDPAESDLATVDPAEVASALTPRDGAARTGPAAPLSAGEREREQAVWWYLMIGALLLLTADAWLANRRPRLAR